MTNLGQYLHDFREGIMRSIVTNFSAVVISFDEENLTATIQPQVNNKPDIHTPSTARPKIENVPVMFYRLRYNDKDPLTEREYTPFLKAGDVVMCTVSYRSMDGAKSGGTYDGQMSRIMNMQDAVIVGIIYGA